MSPDVYRKAISKIGELLTQDKKVEGVTIEVLGGETTLMPFEFWKVALKETLESMALYKKAFHKKYPGELVFITNNTTNDSRYINLLNKYKDHPMFEVFTSWEPDTGRHKLKVMKDRFESNCKKIEASQFCLSIIPTKKLLEIGVDEILDKHAIPLGVNQLNVDMIYPYGSGKAFFEKSQPNYIDVANFYIELDRKGLQKDRGVIVPLVEEVREAMANNQAFSNMGNDSYGVDLDPSGITTLNSTQTGSESESTDVELSIMDDNWALKFIFENTPAYEEKVNGRHDYCFQCKFLTYCSGGYYEHKRLSKEKIKELSVDDGCPGFKQVWQESEHLIGDRALKNHNQNKVNIVRSARDPLKSSKKISIKEKDFEGLGELVIAASAADTIIINPEEKLGKTFSQRLWFYDAVGTSCKFDVVNLFKVMSESELSIIVENIAYQNYKNINLPSSVVWRFIELYPGSRISEMICQAGQLVNTFKALKSSEDDSGQELRKKDFGMDNLIETTLPSGLVLDDRNDELFSYLLRNGNLDFEEMPINEFSYQFYKWLEVKMNYIKTEEGLKARVSPRESLSQR